MKLLILNKTTKQKTNRSVKLKKPTSGNNQPKRGPIMGNKVGLFKRNDQRLTTPANRGINNSADQHQPSREEVHEPSIKQHHERENVCNDPRWESSP